MFLSIAPVLALTFMLVCVLYPISYICIRISFAYSGHLTCSTYPSHLDLSFDTLLIPVESMVAKIYAFSLDTSLAYCCSLISPLRLTSVFPYGVTYQTSCLIKLNQRSVRKWPPFCPSPYGSLTTAPAPAPA